MSKETNTTKTDLSAGTEKQIDSGVKEGDPPVAKRPVKVTEKAVLAKGKKGFVKKGKESQNDNC